LDDRTFRNAMGKFATGITIITTSVDSEVHGMTANAFMSVSLNPKLVMVSVAEKAKMRELITSTGKYAVSILSENQTDMSMYFAGQIKEKQKVDFNWFNGMPVIDGALVNLTCKVYDTHIAGDHTLFIGEVTDIELHDGNALAYFAGQYKTIS
jgi:flavin reductase (DIM6/NTAB) family NADH-FMN oxidoreductase RutF